MILEREAQRHERQNLDAVAFSCREGQCDPFVDVEPVGRGLDVDLITGMENVGIRSLAAELFVLAI
jgi:hypothetical protein